MAGTDRQGARKQPYAPPPSLPPSASDGLIYLSPPPSTPSTPSQTRHLCLRSPELTSDRVSRTTRSGTQTAPGRCRESHRLAQSPNRHRAKAFRHRTYGGPPEGDAPPFPTDVRLQLECRSAAPKSSPLSLVPTTANAAALALRLTDDFPSEFLIS